MKSPHPKTAHTSGNKSRTSSQLLLGGLPRLLLGLGTLLLVLVAGYFIITQITSDQTPEEAQASRLQIEDCIAENVANISFGDQSIDSATITNPINNCGEVITTDDPVVDQLPDNPDLTTDCQVNNTAVIQGIGNGFIESNQLINTVNCSEPDITSQIRKEASDDTLEAGETVTYTIDATNTSDSEALTNAIVTDQITDPRIGLIAGSCVPDCVYNSTTGDLTWNLGTLAPLQTIEIQYQAIITEDADKGPYLNTAELTTDQTEPVDDIAVTNILTNAVSLTKEASVTNLDIDYNNASDYGYDYTINYSNDEETTLINVVLTDDLPDGVIYSPGTCSDNCTYNDQTNQLQWSLGALGAFSNGSVTYSVTFEDGYNFQPTNTFTNIATIDSDQTTPITAQDDVIVTATNPLINVTKTINPTEYTQGDQATYQINYTNTGDQDLTGVYLIDQLDTNLEFVSCTYSCQYDSPTRTIRWDHGNLAINESNTLELTVELVGTGTIPNEVTIFSNEAPNDQSDVNIIVNEGSYLIDIQKTSTQNEVIAGDIINYTLTWSNPSDLSLTDVRILDPITDSRVSYVPNSCSDNCNVVNNTLLWQYSEIQAGTTGTLTYQVQVSDIATPGTISNIVTIESNETDPDQDNQDVDVIEPGEYEATVDKTNPTPQVTINPASPGDTLVTFSINYRNVGNLPLTQVNLEDTLDQRFEFVSCSNSCNYNTTTRNISWNLGTLGVDVNDAVTYTVRLNNTYSFVSGEDIPNTVTLSSLEADPKTDNAETEIVLDDFVTTLNKLANDQIVQPGQNVTYTISYQNNSANLVSNAIITDEIPTDLNYIDSSCSDNCSYDASSRTLTWNLGILTSDQAGTLSYDVVVDTSTTQNTLTNIATFTTDETQDTIAEETVTIERDDLTLNKNSEVYTFSYDDQGNIDTTPFTYTLDYANESDGQAVNAVVFDTLSNKLIFQNNCQPSCEYDAQTRIITWNVGTLEPNEIGQVQFDASLDANQTYGTEEYIQNNAVITADNIDPTEDPNDVQIKSFDLFINKTSNVSVASPGDIVEYTLTFGTPIDSSPQTNVLVTDNLTGTGLNFQSCADCTYDPNTQILSWNIPTLTPGEPQQRSYVVQIDPNIDQGSTVQNIATIDTQQTPPLEGVTNIRIRTPIEETVRSGGPAFTTLALLVIAAGTGVAGYKLKKQRLLVGDKVKK
jgi:uncharacterized repeat protein (TIGR01451 family)